MNASLLAVQVPRRSAGFCVRDFPDTSLGGAVGTAPASTAAAMETTEVRSEHPPSIAQALENTVHDALQLARTEIALAKQEVAEQARSAGRALIFLLVALLFLQAAITTLGVLVLLLRGAALGFAVVGVLVLTALIFGCLGLRGMKRHSLSTASRLKVDVHEVAEAAK